MKRIINNIIANKKTTGTGLAVLIVLVSKLFGFDIENNIGIGLDDIALAISALMMLISKDHDK